MSADEQTAAPAEPVEESRAIRVLGDATPEQVAALVAVLSAAYGGGESDSPGRPAYGWGSPRARLRPVFPHGRGAWSASSRF